MGRTTRDIDMTASRSQMAIHGVIWLLCASIALVSLDPLTASAQWSLGAAGVGRAVAQTVPATATPTVSLSKQDVTVSWSATTLSGGTPVSGYVVRRYNASLVQQTILANCASVTTNSCVEQNVPTGNWTYSVQATRANWFGAESARSSVVAVSSAAFSITARPEGASGCHDHRWDAVGLPGQQHHRNRRRRTV